MSGAVNTTSLSLLQRLKRRNEPAAWKRFVELYAPLIYHWGKGQGLSAQDAADLVQDVLTLLVEKLPRFQYDPTKKFRGWLRPIQVNRARDYQRRHSHRPITGAEATLQLAATADSVDLFAKAEYRAYLVHRAFELMRSEFPERTWRACWLQVIEERSAAEVARELEITLNMAYLAKSRVLRRLREELRDLW